MFKKGDKVEMVRMNDDPDPIPPGTKGDVTFVSAVDFGGGDSFTQVGVSWENGRSLMVVCPPDLICKVS